MASFVPRVLQNERGDIVDLIETSEFPIHYFYWKRKELGSLKSLNQLLDEFREAYDLIDNYNKEFSKDLFFITDKEYGYGIDGGYLKRWITAIELFNEKAMSTPSQ